MAYRNDAVFGLYNNEADLVDASEQLKRNGFRPADLSALVAENPGTNDLGCSKHTKAPEGGITGFILGSIVGGALGYLFNTGILAWPIKGGLADAGGLFTVHPAVAVLIGIGALGFLGALIGFLIGLGRPEYEARRYAGRARSAAALLSVHCDNGDWRRRARGVLKGTGARGVAAAREAKADYLDRDRPRLRPGLDDRYRHVPHLTNEVPVVPVAPVASVAPVAPYPPVAPQEPMYVPQDTLRR